MIDYDLLNKWGIQFMSDFAHPLPDLLDSDGQMRLWPNEKFRHFPHTDLQVWCYKNARYGVPTLELVEWLRGQIGMRSALEIGSGHGDLARFLGIRATDNHMQEWGPIKRYYETVIGQPVIKYGSNVETIDALDAVLKYQPEVVIGSWVTEWIDMTLPAPDHGGNAYGVKEDKILETGAKYILIGNKKVHGKKKIMRLDHLEYELPFLQSRASRPSLDRVFVWL